MNIDNEITQLEKALAKLRSQKELGFSFQTNSGDEDYNIRDCHQIIWGSDGRFAGIVQNVAVMKKYMESLK